MTQTAAERPAFFEGQYLGADDLSALVTYFRQQNARLSLGQHTWGIMVGLNLVEVTAADGTLDVFVQPGVAMDGYGRLIVVLQQTRLEGVQFSGAASGEVEVWIRYDQRNREGVRKGFEVCSDEDVFARINESFALEAGQRSSILERQSGVNVNGINVLDAREALRQVDSGAPLICDASVPHQAFLEADEDALWLIPLGHVRWQGGVPGSFQPLNEEQRVRSRRKRHYVGVVAESLLATDGVIRLRNRTTPFDPAEVADSLCGASALKGTDFYICDNELMARELLWLEGHTRITGDARLFGSRLEFRDQEGRDFIDRNVDGVNVAASIPMLIQREQNNNKNGVDLEILLGQSNDGRNRLSIGRANVTGADLCDLQITGTDQTVFQDDGKVGIGATDTALLSPLTIRGIDAQSELLAFENAASARLWHVDMGPAQDGINVIETAADVSRLHIATGGNVGLGTDSPSTHLHIKGEDPDLFLDINGTSPNSLTELRFGSDGVATSSIYWSKASSKIVVNNEGTNSLVIDEEKVGLGTNNPATTLDIATGNDVTSSDASGYLVIGTQGALNIGIDDNEIQARNNNAVSPLHLQHQGGDLVVHANNNSRFIVRNSGDTGIGTNSPGAKLDVRGNIKMGGAGELFALAGVENLRAIVGQVSSNGAVLQGSGYFLFPHLNTGIYVFGFNTAFLAAPVVVATAYDHDDNVASVHDVTANGFTVHMFDVSGGNDGLQDAAFNFIVMGER